MCCVMSGVFVSLCVVNLCVFFFAYERDSVLLSLSLSFPVCMVREFAFASSCFVGPSLHPTYDKQTHTHTLSLSLLLFSLSRSIVTSLSVSLLVSRDYRVVLVSLCGQFQRID